MNAQLKPRRGPRPRLLTVEAARSLYAQGLTQVEIAERLDTTQRTVCVFMRRNGIAARVAAKRDQRREANHAWVGSKIGYLGAHKRVYRERGKPQKCEHCRTTDDRKYEWANVSGTYEEPSDYIRLCIPCHRKFDIQRRTAA